MQKLHTNEERESIRDEPDLSIDAAQRSMVPMVSVKLASLEVTTQKIGFTPIDFN